MKSLLKIGDKSKNGQVEIVDEDRLCYLVKNDCNGAQGLRTISKKLLAEFVAYTAEHPETTSNSAREALCGKSDIDRFEYGYCATLLMMSKIALEKSGGQNLVPESRGSRQRIFYGAPGTGKSHKVKEFLKANNVPEENIFRTTFHPDSDYSTFVGAYKPTMGKVNGQLYSKAELISKLSEMKSQGGSYPTQRFGTKYWESLRPLTPADKRDILSACGFKESFSAEIDKGIAIGETSAQESRIIYSFIPQSFLNAYIQAYRHPDEDVYLIIEEINRGNCAQIFGDLFQLLDRDQNGMSEYSIKADTDIRAFLEENLGAGNPGIGRGELSLPSNLYIYATMNTSDQSLFPIDSAFKRRWDWEYEPIKYKNDNWTIDINGKKYQWTAFQKEINHRIFESTHSEDKMLGDYFVNPTDGVISADLLRNKIMFYLWNDVCKDGDGDIFRTSETDEILFSDLYKDDGDKKLIDMMAYLGIKELSEKKPDTVSGTESEPEIQPE